MPSPEVSNRTVSLSNVFTQKGSILRDAFCQVCLPFSWPCSCPQERPFRDPRSPCGPLAYFHGSSITVQEGMMVPSGASGPQCLSPTAISQSPVPGPQSVQEHSALAVSPPHPQPSAHSRFLTMAQRLRQLTVGLGYQNQPLTWCSSPHCCFPQRKRQGLRVSRLRRFFLNELRTLICCLSLYYVFSIICFSDNERKN